MAFVPPATLRDVPRQGAVYGKDHPALIVPATEGSEAFTVTYEGLEANVERYVCRWVDLWGVGEGIGRSIDADVHSFNHGLIESIDRSDRSIQ